MRSSERDLPVAGYAPPKLAPSPADDESTDSVFGGIPWMRACGFLLRGIPKALYSATITGALTALVVLLWPASYTVTSEFYPVAASSMLSELSGIAASLGVVAGAQTSPQTSPDFYAALVTSTPVLQSVAEQRFVFVDGRDSVSGTLIDIFEDRTNSQGESLRRTVDDLRDYVNVSTDASTGLITLGVKTKWAPLSVAISNALLQRLDSLDQLAEAQAAQQQQRFLGERVQDALKQLSVAEDALENFLKANRQYQSDPELLVRSQRLQRQIDLRQASYQSLTQAYQQASVEAVRNTPAITVVIPPAPPRYEDKRYVALKVLAGAILGFGLVYLLIAAFDFRARAMVTAPTGYAELGSLVNAKFRFFGRLFRRRSASGN